MKGAVDTVIETIELRVTLALMELLFVFFFFNDTATTEIYTLSLHDALPISLASTVVPSMATVSPFSKPSSASMPKDRKSTRLNSSHVAISYAVFCLKNKRLLGSIWILLVRRNLKSEFKKDPQMSNTETVIVTGASQ